MATQKFMGRNQLLDRLTEQMRTQKSPPKDPAETARAMLISRKMMTADGSLTALGKTRDSMTAEERALDRAAKRTGKPASNFGYNPKTNTATFRKK
jgi:hypothetical protein